MYCHPGTGVTQSTLKNFTTPQPCFESMYCPEGSVDPTGSGMQSKRFSSALLRSNAPMLRINDSCNRRMSSWFLLPVWCKTVVSGGYLLPSRWALGSRTMSTWHIQCSNRYGKVYNLSAWFHMPRVWSRCSRDMSSRFRLFKGDFVLAKSSLPSWYTHLNFDLS
jgi:hypothetical protein